MNTQTSFIDNVTKISFLDHHIGETLLSANKATSEAHTPSGRLSAGRLGDPLQWQVLYTIGVPQKEVDEYAVRLFKRGDHAENWLLEKTPGLIEREKFVGYRDTVGFVDSIVDTNEWGLSFGTIPHEVKSVKNSKFKWIMRDGASRAHKLQAGFYALPLEAKHFMISYIAADDYRVETFLFETDEVREEIEDIISAFQRVRESGTIPAFEALEKWQESPKYAKYPEFSDLSSQEAEVLLADKYPKAYKLLKGIK